MGLFTRILGTTAHLHASQGQHYLRSRAGLPGLAWGPRASSPEEKTELNNASQSPQLQHELNARVPELLALLPMLNNQAADGRVLPVLLPLGRRGLQRKESRKLLQQARGQNRDA